MKQLRQYVRRVLKENRYDLGNKVFSQQAPPGHTEHGEEANTELEQRIYDALQIYMTRNNIQPLMNLQWELQEIMKNPKYSHVFSSDSRARLYRGQIVSRSVLESKAGEDLQAWIDQPRKPYPNPGFTYFPPSFHRIGRMSSWTDDQTKAEDFARGLSSHGRARGIPDPVHVVFVASLGNAFLDLKKLYDFVDLGTFSEERESLALNSVTLDHLYFVEGG